MNDSESAKDFYQLADTWKSGYLSLPLEQRKNWYSEVAEAYHQARPTYRQELICRAVEVAKLSGDANILELGCGPGTATTAFAAMGFSMVCLEPSQETFELARKNCATYRDVKIQNVLFEEWELETKKFNAVLAANAWHWIPEEIAYAKAADALQDRGYLILLWNLTPQPSYELYQALNEVYQIQAPSLARYETRQTQEDILKKFGLNVTDSGRFNNLVSEQLHCEITYSVDNYFTLLNTFSPYRMLEPEKKDSLFTSLREVLEKNCGNSIQFSYLSAFHIAQKM
jgi:SAM-dependent methyltransferase